MRIRSVQVGLRDGNAKYSLSALNMPNFLWEDEHVRDQENMFAGFGRGPLLVIVSL